MKTLLNATLFVVLGFIIAYFAVIRPERADRDNLVSLLDSTRTEFATYRDEMGREITTQAQTVTTLRNALQAQIVENEELERHNLRQVQSITRLESELVRLKTQITFQEPKIIEVPATDTTDWEQYLRVPQQFAFEDTWTDIFGEVTATGITVDDLTIRTGTSIFVGYQRRGFLRKSAPVVIVEYDNPYMSTVKMDNIQITTPRPFYRRPWWNRMEGAVGALLLYRLTR